MLTTTKTIPETVKKIPMGSKTIFEARLEDPTRERNNSDYHHRCLQVPTSYKV